MLRNVVVGMTLFEGLAIGLFAFFLYQRKRVRLANCDWMWGEVIEVKEKPGENGPTRHPVIRYETIGGQQLTFEAQYGRANWNVKPGDKLQIFVDRNDPSFADVATFMSLWGLPVILGVASLLSLVGALACFLVMKE